MEIININMIGIAVALGITTQYFTDKIKYVLPEMKDKKQSIMIALLEYTIALAIVITFDVELFNSNYKVINYLLGSGIVAGGASGVDSFLTTLKNIKNNTRNGGENNENVQ